MKMLLEAHGSFVGKHFWPEGAKRGHPELAELHEHTFNVRIYFEVWKDRQIEFIAFGKEQAEWLQQVLKENPSYSCETMARELFNELEERFGQPPLAIRVQEDESCAAIAVSPWEGAALIATGLTSTILIGSKGGRR